MHLRFYAIPCVYFKCLLRPRFVLGVITVAQHSWPNLYGIRTDRFIRQTRDILQIKTYLRILYFALKKVYLIFSETVACYFSFRGHRLDRDIKTS